MGSPIQRFMDQSLFSAPHDLSQSITSFIASYCQGIHQTPFSRLIWSRKRKTCYCHSRGSSWQVRSSLFWTKSHTFPLLTLEPKLPMSVGPVWKIRNKMSNRLVARVSVLDLDNSVRFSRQTFGRPRKQSWSKARITQKGSAPNWDLPLTQGDQTVLIVILKTSLLRAVSEQLVSL